MAVPPVQYLILYFITALLPTIFMISLFDPHSLAAGALMPQPTTQPIHPFFYLFTSRELLIGLSLAVLEAAGEWRAVAVVLFFTSCNGPVDFVLSRQQGAGFGAAARAHLVPTALGYWASYKLWLEHW